MSLKFDIDIDFADRTTVLEKVQYYTPASIIRDNNLTKHYFIYVGVCMALNERTHTTLEVLDMID